MTLQFHDHTANQGVFRALSDPTRRRIIQMLADKPRSIGRLVEAFEVSRPAVAKHLKILEEGGVIEVRQVGRERINYLSPEGLKRAQDWLAQFEHFWDGKLAELKRVVEDSAKESDE